MGKGTGCFGGFCMKPAAQGGTGLAGATGVGSPYTSNIAGPKTLSIGFVGVPEGSKIESATMSENVITIQPNFPIGTNARWSEVRPGVFAFVVDRLINNLQIFVVTFPDGSMFLVNANPDTAPRADNISTIMLVDASNMVKIDR